MSKRKLSPLSVPSSPNKKIKVNLSKAIFLSNHKASPPSNVISSESEPDYQQIIEDSLNSRHSEGAETTLPFSAVNFHNAILLSQIDKKQLPSSLQSKGLIYILACEKEKYYIGYTTRDINIRFLEHMGGEGAQWTKLYQPKTLFYYDEGDEKDETELTLRMMKEFGFYNVRGGAYSGINISFAPEKILDDGFQLKVVKDLREILKEIRSNANFNTINSNLEEVAAIKSLVYVIVLEKMKILVGITGGDMEEEYRAHLEGRISDWTLNFKPKRVVYCENGGKQLADNISIQLMKKYGYQNVRGTNYGKNLRLIPEELLETDEEKANLRRVRKIICELKQEREKKDKDKEKDKDKDKEKEK